MSKHTQEPGTVPENASMEQVRELLFGAQLKDMELRFKRQEELWLRELNDLRDTIKSRLDSLENFMKSETSTLLHRLREEQAERDNLLKIEQRERAEALLSEKRERAENLKNEQRERTEAIAGLERELGAMTETFEHKITKVSGTLDAAEHELRSLLLTESNALSTKIDERHQNALNAMTNADAHLRHDVVYRSVLSGMFAEFAVKLSGQMTMDAKHMLESEENAPDAPDEKAHSKRS